MTNKVYAPKLKGFVGNTNQWEGFVELLDDRIAANQKMLEQVTDMMDVYKAQGAILALRQLKYLKDELNVQRNTTNVSRGWS